MSSLDRLLATLLQKKQFRYLLAGTASEAIEIIGFTVLFYFSRHLYISNSLSFLLGIGSGFAMHKVWSFAGKHRFRTRHQAIGYCSLAGFNFIMTNLLIGLYVNSLQLNPIVGKVAALATTLIWTYPITSRFIFKPRPAASLGNNN